LWASFGVYDIAARMKPGRIGYTLIDGAVEAHQRFDDAEFVCFYLPGDGRARGLEAGSQLDRLYALTPHVKLVDDPQNPACREALCYCSQQQCASLDLAALGYVEVPLLNSVELRCGRKTHAESGAVSS
jgi:hypothetical protein